MQLAELRDAILARPRQDDPYGTPVLLVAHPRDQTRVDRADDQSHHIHHAPPP
jgi:hypothetical protein